MYYKFKDGIYVYMYVTTRDAILNSRPPWVRDLKPIDLTPLCCVWLLANFGHVVRHVVLMNVQSISLEATKSSE